MKLLVLAGGFGTRLRSAVGDCPKALAPVNGRPFLRIQIDHWINQGQSDFLFLLHFQSDLIIAFLKEMKRVLSTSVEIDWIVEDSPLGTGGSIKNAIDRRGIDSEFMVVNADTWLGGGIRELSNHGAPTMTVVNVKNTARYGRVEISEEKIVTAFIEKGPAGSGFINAGLSCFLPGDFALIEKDCFSLEVDVLPRLLGAQRRLRAVPLAEDFIDIGVPEDYLKFVCWDRGDREGVL